MNSFFEALGNNLVVEILGWTLVHFIWQACVLASFAFIATSILFRSQPSIRYWVFSLSMLAMLACPIATYSILNLSSGPSSSIILSKKVWFHTNNPLPKLAEVEVEGAGNRMAVNAAGFGKVVSKADSLNSFDSKASLWIEKLIPALVVIWITGVAIHLLRMFAGLIRIRQWRKNSYPICDRGIEICFAKLLGQMGIERCTLRRTDELSVSSVMGIWKPMVLMPSSMISGLSITEIELILAHELAHVRRNDYLVNIFQKLVECLFFFHPAVWWVSKQISKERENCCDDIAANVCGNRLALAKALAAMESIRCKQGLAIAANGGALSERVQRLLLAEPLPVRTALPTGIVLMTVFISIGWGMLPLGGPVVAADKNVAGEPLGSPSVMIDPAADDEPNMVKPEVIKEDPVTGLEQRVFTDIRLTSKSNSKHNDATVDLKYSNVIPYTFIPGKIARSLKATKLGEIDFSKHKSTAKPQDATWILVPNDFANPRGYISGGESGVFVDYAMEAKEGQRIVPYVNDPLWAPDHLAFYGLNKTKQTKFDVVRIDVVDIGIGKKFGPVNALVLSDNNSAFGLLGSSWASKVQGKKGERLWHLATGEFRLIEKSPSSPKAHPKPAAKPGKDEDNQDFGELEQVLTKVAYDNDRLHHISLKAIEIGRSATELLKHFSMVIERHGSPEKVDSITNMESIVSAIPSKRFDESLEATDVVFSLPEGSKSQASITGDAIKLSRKKDGLEAVVSNGQVRWIDSVGVVRATAKPAGGAEQLIVHVSIGNDEVVMKIATRWSDPDSAAPIPLVQVMMNVKTGAPANEGQPPHGSIRYEVFEQNVQEDKPLRMKMKWRYDIGRLAKEAEEESGKSWEKIIWGDEYKDSTSDSNAGLPFESK